MSNPTMLDKVRAKLARYRGAQLFEISAMTGISYDSLLRIRDSRTDPGYSLVQRLAELFKVTR